MQAKILVTMLVRVDDDLREELRARSISECRTQAAIIRRALRKYFAETPNV